MLKTIERKVSLLQEKLKRLEKLAQSLDSFEAYQSSPDAKDIAERNLQVAIEACLDIGKIVISNRQLKEPGDNRTVFVVLAEEKLISQESLRFLVPMAGTRNILVHGYDRVDDALIYGILKKHLNDFTNFLSDLLG